MASSFKLLITLLLMFPTNWALSMTSSDSLSVSSKVPLSLSNSNTKEPSSSSSAAATLGDLYRKSRQSRCARCYDDRYGDDYERTRYNSGSGGRGGGGGGGGAPSGYSNYPSRTYDERPPSGGNWYYPRETNDRYDESRVGYGGGRENDRYYYPYNGHYYERSEDRYNTRTYDRYERDRYDSRLSYERSPSETRGYGYGGYESRDRYYPSDRSNDYYRGGDRYPDRNRGSSGGGIYDRYGQDDRYYSRYDYRNYRPWDETYSSPYGGGRGVSRPLSGSYLLDRDNNNVPETSNMAINPDKPAVGDSQINDSPTASKLTSSPSSSSSSSTSKLTEDRVTESKDSN